MSREQRKKDMEGLFVNLFLSLAKRAVVLGPYEAPNFLLTEGEPTIGLEVRQIYWEDGSTGSAARR